MKPVLKRIVLILILLSPVAAWALYKPMRILAPGLVPGVNCKVEGICVDDLSRQSEATNLFNEAFRYVNESVGKIERRPKAVFCDTEQCFRSFGSSQATAIAIGVSGIVFSPRGWTDYYVRHELIHHLQAERLGLYQYMNSPDWFREGMAYSLSNHEKELEEPWKTYRQQFESWHQTIDHDSLWDEARNLSDPIL